MDTTTLTVWATIVNLPGFRLVHLRQDGPDDPLLFTLVPIQELACCPRCGHATESVHRRHRSDPIKDLPVGDRAVGLLLSIPQYKCPHCEHYFTPEPQGVAPGKHATERFLAHIARLLNFSDVANVAALYGVPEQTLARWYYDYLDRQRMQEPKASAEPIKSIGIDELSLKKNTGSSSP